MPNLLDALADSARDETTLRGLVATVSAVDGRFVTLSVRGGSVPGVRTAASYTTPAVNDVVLVARLGSAWVALARLS